MVKYVSNCREIGIEILGPDINGSELDFTITSPTQIRFGLAAIKGLGEAALLAILEARKAEGAFKDFFHALRSTDLQKANRKVWECLIKAGAFDSLEPNRAALIAGLPAAMEAAQQGSTDHGMTSLFDEAEMASVSDQFNLPEDVEPWSRKERLAAERETLGLYVSGHPLEEFSDTIKVHTIGGLSVLREQIAAGKLKDRDEVTVGVLATTVMFKTNQKGEPWAIMVGEDLTDKVECLVMAGHFNMATKQRSRPFETYKELILPDMMLRLTGELKVEEKQGDAGEDEADDAQQVLKIFVTHVEKLEDFQGRGFTGALVRLPTGNFPPNVLNVFKHFKGNLPLQFEYRSRGGYVARVKASSEWNVKFDPDLADRVFRECGCAVTWTY